MFLAVILVPELFRKVRETHTKLSHQFRSKSDGFRTSYDQKTDLNIVFLLFCFVFCFVFVGLGGPGGGFGAPGGGFRTGRSSGKATAGTCAKKNTRRSTKTTTRTKNRLQTVNTKRNRTCLLLCVVLGFRWFCATRLGGN